MKNIKLITLVTSSLILLISIFGEVYWRQKSTQETQAKASTEQPGFGNKERVRGQPSTRTTRSS